MRELREERRITLADLAAQIDFSEGHLSRVERRFGAPRLTAAAAMANTIGLSASELAEIDRSQDKENERLVAALDTGGMDDATARVIQPRIPTARDGRCWM